MVYHLEIILAGRRLNDGMGAYVASEVVKLLINRNSCVKGARVLVLGITFKENCPDIRNSRVIDIIRELQEYGCEVDVADPWASNGEVEHEYGLSVLGELDAIERGGYHAVVAAVGHREFSGVDPREWVTEGGVVYDVKGMYERGVEGSGVLEAPKRWFWWGHGEKMKPLTGKGLVRFCHRVETRLMVECG